MTNVRSFEAIEEGHPPWSDHRGVIFGQEQDCESMQPKRSTRQNFQNFIAVTLTKPAHFISSRFWQKERRLDKVVLSAMFHGLSRIGSRTRTGQKIFQKGSIPDITYKCVQVQVESASDKKFSRSFLWLLTWCAFFGLLWFLSDQHFHFS